MLRVKTKTQESHIKGAGLGLFADQDIPKGEIIYLFDEGLEPSFPSIKNIIGHTEIISKHLLKFVYCYKNNYYYCLDEAKYMNHSEDPNCSDNVKFNGTIAARDIKKGEELTCNYNNLGVTEFDKKFNSASYKNIQKLLTS